MGYSVVSGGLFRKIKQHEQRCEYGEGHEKQMGLTREKIIFDEWSIEKGLYLMSSLYLLLHSGLGVK